MKEITLSCTYKRTTEISIGTSFLFSDAVIAPLSALGERFALFADAHVASLWAERWCAFLKTKGLNVSLFSIAPGEKQKCREAKEKLEDLLFAQQFGKDSCFIAMGGGVLTDLVGFLSSTFCRGVPLVNVPTTLLGMVDAAIGGKTGVDTPFGKNLVGTFYLAEHLFVDLELLTTLPEQEKTSGFAEIIKYALISSSELFEHLSDPAASEAVVKKCIQIKKEVVEEDWEERLGKRRILNFGHTIGHAIELLEEYELSHGEAVAIGMLVESYLSFRADHLSQADLEQILALVRSFPFKLQISSRVSKEGMLRTLSLDKKAAKNKPRFVMLERIGACVPFEGTYCGAVSDALLAEAIEWMLAQFSGGGK